jgi:hypothetical protein
MNRDFARKLRKIARALPPGLVVYEVKSIADGTEEGFVVLTGVPESAAPTPLVVDEMKYPGVWPDTPRTPPRRANSDTPDTPDTPFTSLNENQQLIARASTLLNDMKYAPLSRRERAARATHEREMRQCARLRDPLDW